MRKLPYSLVIIGLIAVVVIVGNFAWRFHLGRSMRVACNANLRDIATAVLVYLEPNLGGNEAEWENQLREVWQAKHGTPFPRCPCGTGPYRLNWAFLPDPANLSPSTIIAYEPLENHGDGASVAYGDGHADFVDAVRFQRLLASIKTGYEEDESREGLGND